MPAAPPWHLRSGGDGPYLARIMENPTKGILLLLVATLCFSISDVMAKILGNVLPVIEIGWVRYLTSVVIVIAMGLSRGRLRVRVRNPGTQLVRGVMMVTSMLAFVAALRFLPIADAAAVGFVSPLLITALSVPMLGEIVGIRRWTAIAVGFVGVLIVIRPGGSTFHPAALLVLASSLTWSVASILTRRLSGQDDPEATMLWTSLVGFGVLTAMVPFDFVMPSPGYFALNIAMGSVATIGQYWMVLAYRHAGAALLAPFSYVQLLWATIFGFAVFATLPDQLTLLGAAIITASGLYTIHRERVRARAKT